MIPILYDNTYASVTEDDAVIGYLADCISCEVTEERNGAYTAELVYPIGGIHFNELKPTRIIRLRANHSDGFGRYQLFRIWKISRPMNNKGEMVCTFYLRHISYDLDGVIVLPGAYFGTVQEAMNDAIARSTEPDTIFDFYSDFPATRSVDIAIETPVSFRAFLAGIDGSLLDSAYEGELEFDNFTVTLHGSRANVSPVKVRYGKNIISLNDDVDSSNTYTHILPYAFKTVDDNTFLVYKNGVKTMQLTGGYDIGRNRVLPVDLTSAFASSEEINQFTVESAANVYLDAHNPKNVIRTLNCQFADLHGYDNYKSIPVDAVALCGEADVYFEMFGIHERMKIIKTTYDVLNEVFTDLTLGEKTASFVDKFASVSRRTNVLKAQVDVLMQR